jgi:hypothetical protein
MITTRIRPYVFHVTGMNGGGPYTVNFLRTMIPTCTCSFFQHCKTKPCKHIKIVQARYKALQTTTLPGQHRIG